MDFEPNTTIWFLRTGIDEFNKVVCKTQEELVNCLTRNGNVQGMASKNSFQRADGLNQVRVDHSDVPYYGLLQSDTVLYKNEETTGAFWIVGNIVSVEWRNPDCSFVRFKIDSFMTYQSMIDWEKTFALVEREHVKDDWSAEGGNPLFSNMGPAEDFGVAADTLIYSWTKSFKCDYVVVLSPYDQSGNPVFDGSVKGNLYSSLQVHVFTPAEANNYFKTIAEKKDASINNIVGVYGLPQEFARIIQGGGLLTGDHQEDIPAVHVASRKLKVHQEFNNAKCWSAPFYSVKLMSSEGEEVQFTPQWFGNDQSEFTVKYRYGGSGGQFGAAQCTFHHKNGAFNWDAWNDFIVSIKNLPSCPWTGDGFTDWAAVNYRAVQSSAISTSINNIGSAVSNIVSGAESLAKGSISGAVSGVVGLTNAIDDSMNESVQIEAKINQVKASGAAVNGMGSFSPLMDLSANSWGFKVVYYATQSYIMSAVDAYFDRFGYRVNKLKKIGINNRPIWTFTKTAECHIAATTGIPYLNEMVINRMFNNGVTLWNAEKYLAGRKIGDFSNAKENKGVQGG